MDSTESDDELVRRFRENRDNRLFDELMRRHQDRVFRLAVSILGPSLVSEAEDVVQETFVRVHHSINRFRGDANFSSWVYRIAYNVALDLKAKSRHRNQRSVNHLAEDVAICTASGNRDSEQREVLEMCIGQLPEAYQSAIRLHYWLGRSVAECAELLGVPVNTIKSYLHRARKLLAHTLKMKGIDHE